MELLWYSTLVASDYAPQVCYFYILKWGIKKKNKIEDAGVVVLRRKIYGMAESDNSKNIKSHTYMCIGGQG